MGTLFIDYLQPKPYSFHATTATLRLLASRIADEEIILPTSYLDGMLYPSSMLLHVACLVALSMLFSVIVSLSDSREETCASLLSLGA